MSQSGTEEKNAISAVAAADTNSETPGRILGLGSKRNVLPMEPVFTDQIEGQSLAISSFGAADPPSWNAQTPPIPPMPSKENDLLSMYAKGLEEGMRLALQQAPPPDLNHATDQEDTFAFQRYALQSNILPLELVPRAQETALPMRQPPTPLESFFSRAEKNGFQDQQANHQALVGAPSAVTTIRPVRLPEQACSFERRYAMAKRNKAHWRDLVGICQECVAQDAIGNRTRQYFRDFCSRVLRQHVMWQLYDGHNNSRDQNVEIMFRFASMGSDHPNKDFLTRAKRIARCLTECPDAFERLHFFEKPLSHYRCPNCQKRKTLRVSGREATKVDSAVARAPGDKSISSAGNPVTSSKAPCATSMRDILKSEPAQLKISCFDESYDLVDDDRTKRPKKTNWNQMIADEVFVAW